jgi:hypothetical protein
VAKSRKILEREIINQSYPDGCTREHAFGYQAFVLQFFSLSAIVATKCGKPFTPQFADRLRHKYEFLAEISQDTGTIPCFGDGDDGYVLDLGDKPDCIENLLSVGAQMFDTSTLQFPCSSETCAWLFGKERRAGDPRQNSIQSKDYPDPGYFILRNRPSDASKLSISIFFDCAELGFGAIAAHGHADCLSFSLAIDGVPVLVDPGTYDYFTYPEWRNYFRSTAAHNTVEIDGQSQSTSTGPFMWSDRARPSLIKWQDDEHATLVKGSHDGYVNDGSSVIHTRALSLDKTEGNIDIRDMIDCGEEHQVVRYFHLAPDFSAIVINSSRIHISNGSIDLDLKHDAQEAQIVIGDENSKIGWISTGYHRKTASSSIRLLNHIAESTDFSIQIRQS